MNERDKRSIWVAWVIVMVFLIMWEVTVRAARIPSYILPAPTRVIVTLAENPGMYAQASLFTLGEALIGLFLGILSGVLIACVLTLFPGIEGGVMTLAILVKSTPMVAIAPLLTIWLGFGVLPKILITALMTFFPVLVNVLSGLQRVDTPFMDLFNTWSASRWEVFRHLRIPSAMPYLFAALKISAPLALIGAVVAEWTGASGGLGRVMWLAYTNLNLPFLFGSIIILAIAGIIFYRASVWAEAKAIFWLADTRENS